MNKVHNKLIIVIAKLNLTKMIHNKNNNDFFQIKQFKHKTIMIFTIIPYLQKIRNSAIKFYIIN